MNTSKKLKLFFRSLLTQFGSVDTEKGRLVWDGEGELAVDLPVFVEVDSESGEIEYAPAEDGEYIAEGRVIVISEGKVAEIREAEKPAEEPAQEPMAEEPAAEPAAEPEPAQEPEPEPEPEPAYDAEAADREAIARIEALESELEAIKAQLAALAAAPVAESAFSADKKADEERKPLFRASRN